MNNSIVIEVGANIGQDTKPLHEKYPEASIYSFEPVPILYAQLIEKFLNNSKINIIPFAVDIEDGIKDFYINMSGDKGCDKDYPYGCSSLHQFSDNVDEEFRTIFGESRPSRFHNCDVVKVKTVRLDTFLEKLNFSGEIKYLHCDAQGNDINVLKSLGKYIQFVKEGQIEVAAQAELYKNTRNRHDEAVEFLRQNRFSVRIPRGLNRHETDIYFRRV